VCVTVRLSDSGNNSDMCSGATNLRAALPSAYGLLRGESISVTHGVSKLEIPASKNTASALKVTDQGHMSPEFFLHLGFTI